MEVEKPILTKSLFLQGLECPLTLWCLRHAPEELTPLSQSTLNTIATGQEVGLLAQKLYPEGHRVSTDLDIPSRVLQTREWMKEKKVIFEGAFQRGSAYAQADILVPRGEEWDLIEVKSGTEVQDNYLWDIAFQRYCIEEEPTLKIRYYILYINKNYKKGDKFVPSEFFTQEEVSHNTEALVPEIPKLLDQFLAILAGPRPEPRLGDGCRDPKSCRICLTRFPKQNITQLYRIMRKQYCELLNTGVTSIESLPIEKLNAKQQIQVACMKTGKWHWDSEKIEAFLSKLTYPLYFLDFETICSAIPIFKETRPYQQIPFQFSLHILQRPDGIPDHIAYLAEGRDDPSPSLIKSLQAIAPDKGTVLCYNKTFEQERLKELALAYPEASHHLLSIVERLEDLIIPFRNFWCYHPLQKGSCSIKAVLPAWSGKSYAHLEIQSGDQAANRFLEFFKPAANKPVDQEKFLQLRRELLAYCKLDTEAMLILHQCLQKGGPLPSCSSPKRISP